MIEQNSFFSEDVMHFDSDKNRFAARLKSERLKKALKTEKQTVENILNSDYF